MATLHGETAKYPKAQAERKYMLLVLTFSAIAMTAGVLIGVSFMQKNILLALLSAVAGLVSVPMIMRPLNGVIRRLGKERIWYWRGAQVEALVAWIIKVELDANWHLFNSVKLQENWDIDHVLVGPGGLFVISTKSQRGCFSVGADGTLLLNGKRSEMAREALGQALELRSRLEALMGADVPFVQAILAAPFAYTDFAETSQTVWVLHQENLSDTLEREAKKKRISAEQVRRTLRSVETLASNAEKLYRKPLPEPAVADGSR